MAAAEHRESAVKAAEMTGQLASHLVSSGSWAEVLVVRGLTDEAIAVCERAAVLDQTVDSPRSWAMFRTIWSWALVVRGELETAGRTLSQALAQASADVGDLRALWLLVDAERRWSAGDPGFGRDGMESLLSFVEDPDTRGLFAPHLARLARILAASGNPALLEKVLADSPRGTTFHENSVLTAEAVLARANGDHAEAAELLHKAAAAWDVYGYPLEQAHALLASARSREALGQPDPTVAVEARALYDRVGARLMVDEAERLIAAQRP